MPPSFSAADTRYLTRPEGRIAYDVQGAGPLVVCLPGMGDLRQTFRYLVPPLVAAGYRVATADLRGHGESDATFTAYDVAAAVEDLQALVDALGGPAVVVGNSMGASAAALFAAEHPGSVRGLVLAGPFLRDGSLPAWQRALFRLATARPWAVAAWKAWLPKLYAGRAPADAESYLAAVSASMARPGHAAAFARTTRSSHRRTAERLSAVRAPALVLMGAADPDFPDPAAEAAWCAGQLRAETVLVDEAGHFPLAQRPDVAVPAVLDFLGRVGARA